MGYTSVGPEGPPTRASSGGFLAGPGRLGS
ncbi:hypothetical protein [Lysobacter enzymogenes]